MAIDAHAHLWVVKIKIDGSLPAATRQFKDRGLFIEYVRQCLRRAQVVCSCYEAEPTAQPAEDRWLPVYFGTMTAQILDAEICDWDRFRNVRQVGGFFGLTPTVFGSAGRYVYGSISKHGNPRLRVLLIELAWRMIVYQRGYWAMRKWSQALQGPKPRRKKAAVAIARCLAVDLWRWKTGRVMSLRDLGFRLAPEAEAA
jgi:hypothetical protein